MNRELLKQNFENHGFATKFFDTAKEAADYLSQQIQGTSVALGGSVTLTQMGIFDLLAQNNTVVSHGRIPGSPARDLARHAKIYITSANGVSETGELVNIDGTGNRVANTLFGPEKVYFVVGKNKIAPDLPKALYRAKNIAAPKNAQRLHCDTPCAVKGDKCYNCNSPQRICKATVILERPTGGVPAEILFVEEELGY